MWGKLFTPICRLHLHYEWDGPWMIWLFAKVGGNAWYEDEVKRGMWDKDGNPTEEDEDGQIERGSSATVGH